MTTESVTTEFHRATSVGIASIARGEHNYLDADVLDELAGALDRLAAEGARAVVLRSGARNFCAGVDVAGGGPAGGRHLYDVVPRLFALPVPVVAAIDGAVVGGGLGLALACDFRITAARSRFAGNFARLGFSQGFALTLTLPRLVGGQRAAELLYTGRWLDGPEAVGIGLCDGLSSTDVVEEAYGLASDVARSAPLAVEAIRSTLRRPLTSAAVQEALAAERHTQERLMRTSDFREGVRALRERREPVFSGQ